MAGFARQWTLIAGSAPVATRCTGTTGDRTREGTTALTEEAFNQCAKDQLLQGLVRVPQDCKIGTSRVLPRRCYPDMSDLRNLLPILFAAVFLLAGCAGQPSSNSDTTGVSKPREGTSDAPPATTATPSRETPAQPRPQPSTPEASSEGITIFELQERLSWLGYKLGDVDGVNGPRTIAALKRFQSDNNLPVTGAIDAETIRRLRNAKPQP